MSGVANPVKMLMAKKVDLNRFMLKMIGNKVLIAQRFSCPEIAS